MDQFLNQIRYEKATSHSNNIWIKKLGFKFHQNRIMFEETTSLLVAAGPESTLRLRSTTQLRRGDMVPVLRCTHFLSSVHQIFLSSVPDIFPRWVQSAGSVEFCHCFMTINGDLSSFCNFFEDYFASLRCSNVTGLCTASSGDKYGRFSDELVFSA